MRSFFVLAYLLVGAASCDTKVEDHFKGKTLVRGAQKRSLDCERLGLEPDMQSLHFTYFTNHYTAYVQYHETVEVAGTVLTPQRKRDYIKQYTWVGALHEAEAPGTVTVAWDDDCTAERFQLNVAFYNSTASAAGNTTLLSALTTIPCSTTDSSCIYTTAVRLDLKEDKTSLAPELPHRHLRGVQQDRKLADDKRVIDVLWVYTTKTQQRYGDTAIVSKIAAGVASANMALDNSRTFFKLRAVAILPIPYTETTMQDGWNQMIAGTMPNINNLRNQYGADLVQVVTEATDVCGYGTVLPANNPVYGDYAFSLVASDCFSNLSHLHEILHTMGAQHNIEDASPGTWPYGVGQRFCNDGTSTPPFFGTVMAYSCLGSSRIPYISTSNLNIQYQGRSVGSSQKDNARVIRDNRQLVANFRTKVVA